MTITLNWFSDHCVAEYSGTLTIKQSLNLYGEMVGSPNFDNMIYIIVDCRKLKNVQYKENDYHIHAAISKSSSDFRRSPIKVAAIVSNKESEKAVINLIAAQQDHPHNWERKIFWNYDEGIDWARNIK